MLKKISLFSLGLGLVFLVSCGETKTDDGAPSPAIDGEIDSAGAHVEKTYPYEIEAMDWDQSYWFVSKTALSTMDSTNLASAYGVIFGTVFPYLMEQQVMPVTKPIALSWETPENVEDSVSIIGGALVADSVDAIEGVMVQKFFTGKVLRISYYGPYMEMEGAYASAKEYMADNDLEPTGFGWEEYVSDPETVSPDSILTYIYRGIK